MIELRPYQVDIVERVEREMEGAKRGVVVVAPTGAGKTVCQSELARRAAARAERVCVLVHRRELIRQQVATLARAGVEASIIAPGHHPTERLVHVASVDTLRARLAGLRRYCDGVSYVTVDECHHLPSDSWSRARRAFRRARVSGWSASPYRLDGKGLGDHFDRIVQGPSVAALTDMGWLAPARVLQPPIKVDMSSARKRMGEWAADDVERAVDRPEITDAVVRYWADRARGRPTIVFCASVVHTRNVAQAFRRALGIKAIAIDGSTPEAERDAAVLGLGDGSTDLVANCQILGEGFDCPAVGAGILLRPTLSVGLYQQHVGRILRAEEDKHDALIIDVAGNTMAHGMPDTHRPWSLLEGVKGLERLAAKPVRCIACHRVQHAAEACVECGRAIVTPGGAPAIQRLAHQHQLPPWLAPGLRELGIDALRTMNPRELTPKADTKRDVEFLQQLRGWKPGWVWMVTTSPGWLYDRDAVTRERRRSA